MDKDKLKLIEKILYSEYDRATMEVIRVMDDAFVLHEIALNYNWDDGATVPTLIIDNEYCDLGTALLIFFDADGYTFLDLGYIQSNEIRKLQRLIYDKVAKNGFKTSCISYKPDLSKVQIYKLLKKNPTIQEVFFKGVRGSD